MLRSRITALLSFVAVLVVAAPALAWTGPTQSPPAGNVSAPVNVGSTFQDKAGQFWADGGIGVNSGSAFCIGASCITSWAGVGGSNFTGSGSTSYLAKFTGATALGNSIVSDNGATATVSGALSVSGSGWSILATGGALRAQGTAGGWGLYVDSGNAYIGGSMTVNAGLTVSGAAIGVQGTNTGNNNWGGYFSGGYGVFAQDSSGIYGELGNGSWSFYGNGNTYTAGYTRTDGYLQVGTYETVSGNNGGDAIYASTGNIHTHGSLQADGVSGSYAVAAYGGGGIYSGGPIQTDAGGWAVYATAGGIVTTGSNGGWAVYAPNGNGYFGGQVYSNGTPVSSDERLKKDIQPLTGNLAKVLQLQPVTYFWKDPTIRGQGQQIGFIAQQVEPIVPQIVFTDASTTLKSLDYSKLTPLLVGSVQELNQKIADQQTQLDAQQKQIDALTQQLQALQNK